MSVIISRTDLARRTREVVDRVQRGQMVVVKSYGEEQVVLLDVVDYRILKALAACAMETENEEEATQDDWGFNQAIRSYMNDEISLGRTATLLGMSRFELMERFERVGIPLRVGPATLEEAQEEIEVARRLRKSGS